MKSELHKSLGFPAKYANTNQERYRKILAVSCQMASFRGSWRNQMVTKTRPTILAQLNTCPGRKSAGSPHTSKSTRGATPWPAIMRAIEYVTSKIGERQNAIMVRYSAFQASCFPRAVRQQLRLSWPE